MSAFSQSNTADSELFLRFWRVKQGAMNGAAQHPIIAGFENLLALRSYVQSNPNDGGALFLSFCCANFPRSRAQLFQDLLVVFLLKGKRNGFFVEFGATNGLDLSNTAILERDFQWKGLLAEPAKCWHAVLKENRSATVDHRCVWSQTGETLTFKATEIAELSTLATLVDTDFNRDGRANGKVYPVETISLNDLLKFHKCPRQIDYLSIDTEGSELEILRAFKFDDYDISIITVEHNFREPDRQVIFDLLTSKGLVRLFDIFSKFDDWYVKRSIVGL
jgi:FkbM family methyltransferase